jgi:hypothetical protein
MDNKLQENKLEDTKLPEKKPNFLARLGKNFSGNLTHTALSATSAWMIVTGLKGLAGFTVNQQTALADLLGIVIVIAVVRYVKFNKAK